jgi:flavorubredoxin
VNSIVVYASRHGNTEKIAYAIAAGLRHGGPVQVYEVAQAPLEVAEDLDLFVVGGPTEAHGLTRPVAEYLGRLTIVPGQAASFDTRLRMARWLSGSAAIGIMRRLRALGAKQAAEPASFFVAGKVPALEPGELERAEAWAIALVEAQAPAAMASA